MTLGLFGPHGGFARRAADGAKDRPNDLGQSGVVDPALGEILGGLPAESRHNARGDLDPRHRQQAGGVGVSQVLAQVRLHGIGDVGDRGCSPRHQPRLCRRASQVAEQDGDGGGQACQRVVGGEARGLQTPVELLGQFLAKLYLKGRKVLEVHIKCALRHGGGLHDRIHRDRRRLRRGVAGARRLHDGGTRAVSLGQANFRPSLQIHSCHVHFLRLDCQYDL